MTDIGLNLPKSEIINNIKQAKKCLKKTEKKPRKTRGFSKTH